MALTMLADFHFLRPAWLLLLLPLAGWLIWRVRSAGTASAWTRACDPALLRALGGGDARRSHRPLGTAGMAAAIVALAGPSWQRNAQPVLEINEARVVLLDLSRSMDAQDLRPSRLSRTRVAIHTLLDEMPGGRIAIVAFAGGAFTVVPLTDDRRTAKHLLDVLSTSVMPSQGGDLGAALAHAGGLLAGGGALRGDVIVFSDSRADARAHEAAKALAEAGHRLWIVGVGTKRGGPVPLPQGGVLQDETGAVVTPALEEESLRELARQGHGRYERLAEAGLSPERWQSREVPAGSVSAAMKTDSWRDEGRWLILFLLPLAALCFRRGSLAVAGLLACLLPTPPAHAFEWETLWSQPDQIGARLLASGDAEAASRNFKDPHWRGVAHYRAGDYRAAAQAFAQADTADAHYNRGNALARAGRYADAVASYDAALERAPEMDDARFNRALVERLVPPRPNAQVLGGGTRPSAEVEASGSGPGQQQRQQAGERPEAGAGASPRATQGGDEAEGDAGDVASKGTASAPGADAAGDAAAGAGSADARGPARGAQDAGTETARSGAPPRAAPGGDAQSLGRDLGRSPGAAGRDGREEPVLGDSASEWLRQVPDDPGALLRRKFARLQARRDPVEESGPQW